MAPFAIGVVTLATGSTRLGVACVLVFLVLGLALLWRVREERAVAVSLPEGFSR
jgi:UMF1 family MFS transporter